MEFGSPETRFEDSPQADEALGYEAETEQQQTPEQGHVAGDGQSEAEWDGIEADYEDETDGQAEPPAQAEPQRIFGKYSSMEEAQRGYDNLNAAYGRQSQEVGALRQAVQQMYGILQQQQAAQQQQEQPEAKMDPAQLWEQLAENPQQAISQMVNPLVEQRIAQERQAMNQAMQQMMAPVMQQQTERQMEARFGQEVQALASKYPDLADHTDSLKEAIRQNPHLLVAPNGWDTLYKIAKFESVGSQQGTAKKRAARLPQTGGRVTRQRSQNDELVEDALGPMSSRGEWG